MKPDEACNGASIVALRAHIGPLVVLDVWVRKEQMLTSHMQPVKALLTARKGVGKVRWGGHVGSRTSEVANAFGSVRSCSCDVFEEGEGEEVPREPF